ncbi:MAG: response regulator, partial [Nitrospinae bacterium]|nr:response regulator [Nitrospinota bacterium]
MSTVSVQNNLKILVVDDDEGARKLTLALLKKSGFQNCLQAENGSDALQLLIETQVDLVICDWDMPNLNGVELHNLIKANPALPEVPFIMITSFKDRDHVIKAASTGIRHYIVKPLEEDVLRDKIES